MFRKISFSPKPVDVAKIRLFTNMAVCMSGFAQSLIIRSTLNFIKSL